jgi:hypothetical protein
VQSAPKIFRKILAKIFEDFCGGRLPLCRPAGWACLWRRLGVKAALAAQTP